MMVGFGSGAVKKLRKRVVVGVGDMAIASDRDVILSTFALGSCVGVVILDSDNGIGGLLHIMLPSSSVAVEKSVDQPFLFADTGVAKFLSMLRTTGADLQKSKCVVAGGASVMGSIDAFKIGEKNARAVKSKLNELGVLIDEDHLGGYTNRTLHLNLRLGNLTITLPNEKQEIKLV